MRDCISLRPARTRHVRAIQIIEQEIKSDPIQELRKETRESQIHKFNDTESKSSQKTKKKRRHCSHQRQAPAAPRSWRLGERPTVRRKEDVVAEALTEGVASTVPEKTMMSLRRGRRRLGGGRRLQKEGAARRLGPWLRRKGAEREGCRRWGEGERRKGRASPAVEMAQRWRGDTGPSIAESELGDRRGPPISRGPHLREAQ